MNEALIECENIQCAARESRMQRDPSEIYEIRTLSTESRMRFVAQDEHDVRRHRVGAL